MVSKAGGPSAKTQRAQVRQAPKPQQISEQTTIGPSTKNTFAKKAQTALPNANAGKARSKWVRQLPAQSIQVAKELSSEGIQAAKEQLAPSKTRYAKPLPDGRADSFYDGAFIGKDGKAYGGGTGLPFVPPVTPKNGETPKGDVLYVNGIQSTRGTQAKTLQKIADQTGANVYGVHNATAGTNTRGFIEDLRESGMDKMGLGKHPSIKTLANTIYDKLKKEQPVHLMGHSQGGLVLSRALREAMGKLKDNGLSKKAIQHLMKNVQVETFGAAAQRYPDGPKYTHYYNQSDPVPRFLGQGNWFRDPGKQGKVIKFRSGKEGIFTDHNVDLYLQKRAELNK